MCRAANFTAREREAREDMQRSAERTRGGKCSGWIETGIIKKWFLHLKGMKFFWYMICHAEENLLKDFRMD